MIDEEKEYKKICDEVHKLSDWIHTSNDPRAKKLKKEIESIIDKWKKEKKI